MVFVYPVLVAVLLQMYVAVFISLGLLLSSFIYHNNSEKKFLRFDLVFSVLAISYNLYLCYLFDFNIIPFGVASIFLIVGLFSYFKAWQTKYVYYHTMWHISCAAISVCCYIGYAFYR
jgi:hypothetical protein